MRVHLDCLRFPMILVWKLMRLVESRAFTPLVSWGSTRHMKSAFKSFLPACGDSRKHNEPLVLDASLPLPSRRDTIVALRGQSRASSRIAPGEHTALVTTPFFWCRS